MQLLPIVVCLLWNLGPRLIHAYKNCHALTPHYDGTEDISVLRDGMALASIGLQIFTQIGVTGAIMGIDTTTDPPSYANLTILSGNNNNNNSISMPESFRPHGIYIANVTTDTDDDNNPRLFVVSHENVSGEAGEESIFVFDIVEDGNSSTTWPTLEYRYRLISSSFPNSWFLNDLVVVPGMDELFVTQFWADDSSNSPETFVWHCSWTEEEDDLQLLLENGGAIDAFCEKAHSRSSSGYNGITMSVDGTRLWANDLPMGNLIAFDIDQEDRSLTLSEENTIHARIPATGLDNIELDYASGDIITADMVTGRVFSVPRVVNGNSSNEYSTVFRQLSLRGLPSFIRGTPSSATVSNGITLVGFAKKLPLYYCEGVPEDSWIMEVLARVGIMVRQLCSGVGFFPCTFFTE